MGIHKLTEQKAKLLDKVLKFMLEASATRGMTVAFNYGEFLLNKILDEKSQISEEGIKSCFIIADNYLKDSPKPYENQNGRYLANRYTPIFLSEGGFYALWEDDNIKDNYIEQLRKSTLNTNRWMRWLTLILALAALCTLIIEVSKLCKSHKICKANQPKQQELLTNKKDSIHNDSSYQIQGYNKDSLKKKKPESGKK